MNRVVVFGSAVVDVVMKSKDFKVLKSHEVQGGVALCEVYGGKMGVEEMEMSTGAAGTNVAVGLARLGCIPASVCRVGNDLFGKMIVDELEREKVESSQVQMDEKKKTGVSVVLVAEGGGRSILTYRGVSKEIEKEKIDWEKLANAEWWHMAAFAGEAALLEDIVALAAEKHIRVSWNPGKKEIENREEFGRLVRQVEVVILNRLEASLVTGEMYEDEEKIWAGMRNAGVKAVITDGDKGAVWIDGERILKVGGVKVVSVDDTGAGDAFCAGLIAGLVRGEEVETAMKMGICNGASQVTELGAKTGLLRKEGMEKWLGRKIEVEEDLVTV